MSLGKRDKYKEKSESNAPDIYYNTEVGPNNPSKQVDKNTSFFF